MAFAFFGFRFVEVRMGVQEADPQMIGMTVFAVVTIGAAALVAAFGMRMAREQPPPGSRTMRADGGVQLEAQVSGSGSIQVISTMTHRRALRD